MRTILIGTAYCQVHILAHMLISELSSNKWNIRAGTNRFI